MSATIFALSTPRGRGGLAVVRMSGGEAADILRGLIGELPAPRRASLRSLIDPAHDDLIDQAVVLYFPAPNSATGEDVVEFHLHGGNAVTSALLEFLGRQLGCRMAKPGEFTRRAFENGKLDLTGAEGLADLIEADTAQQRRQALRQLGGDLGRLTEDWAHRLMRQMAYLEAVIDFPDEDLPSHLLDPMLSELERLAAEMHQQLDDGRRGEILRDGVHVAIIGPPNSGKSSLLNALAGRDAAIVSHVAGTTRDVVEVRLALDGFPVILADTAGLRESADPIEAEGMRRALARAEAADITVLVLDASLPESLEGFREQAGPDGIVVWNKCDLPDARPRAAEGLLLSVRTGNGLKNLTTALAKRAEAAAGGPPAVVTRLRHREAIAECAEALERVFHVKHADFDAELVAEDLRMALRALGRLTGRIDVEDLLDIVFRDFCIGK